MELSKRIAAFVKLGNYLQNLPETQQQIWIQTASNQNSWFIAQSIELAWQGVIRYLQADTLTDWVSKYPLDTISSKKVGVIMAGNIPLVGFHDLLSVLISGHFLMAKLSSQDTFLMQQIIRILTEIEPQFAQRIQTPEMLQDAQAYIATGSDNSARYFEYYFAKYPYIIRKNRSSVAILTNEETEQDLCHLGHDMLDYFGLGCRNVSKIYVPESYDFQLLMKTIEENFNPNYHHKYRNNYEYNKSVYLVNREPHLDNEQILVREDTALVSPISVLYYERYNSDADLLEKLKRDAPKIQCIVSKHGDHERGVKFGEAQSPHLWDYADGVDTMAFLANL